MQELGVSTNANYKITFMLDSAAMITVHTPRRGLIDVSTNFSPNNFVHSAGILSHPFKILNQKKKKVVWEFSCRKTARILEPHIFSTESLY